MERASPSAVWQSAKPLLRPVRARYLGAAAAVTVSTLITLSGPALVRYAVDAGIKKHDTHPLNVAALIFLALAVLKPFVVRTQILLAATAGEHFLHALRIAAFDKLQALPLGFFERERAGVLVSRLTSDVQSLNELVRDALVEIAGSALQIVLTMAALLFLSPRLAVIEQSRVASITRQAASRPPATSNETTEPAARCWRFASACCGCDSSPG